MSPAPDLVVLGRIASMAGESGFGWIEGLAVEDGRVAAAGARYPVAAMVGTRTPVIELTGDEIALPAITDAHLHLVAAALAADEVDLEGTASLEAALGIVAEAHDARSRAGDRTGWLLGHGWATDGWADRPSGAALEGAAPGRPIALWAHDHHTRWLSLAALGAMGIDATTQDPPGGRLGRDADGRPDGLLYEHATRLGATVIPAASEATIRAALIRYAGQLAALGVTGVHDPGGLAPETSLAGGFMILRAMAAEGQLPLRVHAGIRDEQLEAAVAVGLRSGAGVATDPGVGAEERHAAARFHVGWLKLFADGSVGSRTAAMLEPYDDALARPGPDGPSGSLLETRERLTERVEAAADAGIATMIHAIGDRAARTALGAFEAVGPRRLARLALMPRIEHAQLVDPDDVPRFGRLGVAASMQPVQLRSDEAMMRRAWGRRTPSAFPMASLTAGGCTLAIGTDAPVEPPDPWPGIALAVTRRAPEWGSDTPASGPDEAVTLELALRSAVVGPWSTARQPLGGRLVVGAPADLIIVALAAHADEGEAAEVVRTTRPLLTLLDGIERHRAPGFDR